MTSPADIPGSYARKVARGLTWVTVTAICVRTLNFASAIILARLLVPADFGLMAIATAVISFSQRLTSMGFDSALIQKQAELKDFLNTAWTFELFRNFGLALIVFLTAPLLAAFFNDPRATIILQVLSITYVLQALNNIGVIYFRKNLEFHKQFVLEMVPMVFYISTVIPLAYVLQSVWALVWAAVVSQAVGCVVSYILHPHRPRLDFYRRKAGELFHFGRWILGSSIIAMIREQGVTMFIGRLMGMTALGFYNRAGVFSSLVFQQVDEIAWKIGYPLYSELQSDARRLKDAFLRSVQIITFIVFPMAGGLFVLSGDFTRLFLTERWLPVVPLMKLFCIQAVFSSVNVSAGILFQATGRPEIGTKISFISIIMLLLMIYPLSLLWHETGAVVALIISVIIVSPVVWTMAIRVSGCGVVDLCKPILVTSVCTAVMLSCVFILRDHVFMRIAASQFLATILVASAVYLITHALVSGVVTARQTRGVAA